MSKYNFVILGSSSELYSFSYSDLFSNKSVRYIPEIKCLLKNKYLLYRVHKYLFKRFGIGGLRIWNRFLKIEPFEEDKPICFMYMWSWVDFNDKTKIVDYFRNKYPESKHVLFLQDIAFSRSQSKATYQTENAKNDFDLIYSFDPGDCKRYGFIYHPLVFSNYEKHNVPVIYDIYMLALVKDRLETIYEMYDMLSSHGLSLCFMLAGVPDDKKVEKPGIHYVDYVPYKQNLLYIEQSRCLLEIMQSNGVGYTQRGCEAVCIGKKLLTNNTYIENEKFFNPLYISVFNTVKDVDKDFLNKIKDNDNVDYGVDNRLEMSPLCLLEQIEKDL